MVGQALRSLDGPGLEGVTESLVGQPSDDRRVVEATAPPTESSFALVPRNHHPAAVPFENEVGEGLLCHSLVFENEATVTLGALAFGLNTNGPFCLSRLDPTVGATLSSCETSSAEYLAPLGAIYLVKLMIARTAGESTDVFDERMQELVPNPARYRTST